MRLPVFLLWTPGGCFLKHIALIGRTNMTYGIRIQVFFPDYHEVEKMVAEHGVNLFYDSIEHRRWEGGGEGYGLFVFGDRVWGPGRFCRSSSFRFLSLTGGTPHVTFRQTPPVGRSEKARRHSPELQWSPNTNTSDLRYH